MEKREPKIFLIAGRARHGKDTVAAMMRGIYLKNGYQPERLQFSYYIKDYAKRLTSWDGSEETKGDIRNFLQELGTEIIRKQIDSDFFINRVCEDIMVYSFFCDVLTISDVRFPREIEVVKSRFPNVISILVDRPNFDSPLAGNEKNHATEVALDDYHDYDYVIKNDGTIEELKEKVLELVKEVEKL